MNKVYVLDGARSFIGVENSMYRHVPAEKLAASLLIKLREKYRDSIDFVIAGNAVGAGGNIARLALLEADFPQNIPAVTLDLQCGSGLEAISLAAAKIISGQANLVLAGGFESSSTAPRRAYHRNHPEYEAYGGEASFYSVAKFSPGEHVRTAMLEGAERTALSEGVKREDLDHWVLESHAKALRTREQGTLRDIALEVIAGCDKDEGIRTRMTERFLKRLPPVLKGGTVLTAANTCLTNDGAAFLVLASGETAERLGIRPLAEFVDGTEIGGDPRMSPKTAVSVVENLLSRNQMTEKDISIFECNEAFAVIDELFMRRFPGALDKYNIFGGALAYGHPYGASGGIISLHAIQGLKERNGEYAVCSIAAAGGVGTAILLKNSD
ncbi:MAG: thiolase family protein [Lachnospiraceae bacterium]|nr:thiolase family protein [Lachnospiraceae bacterium]